MSEVMVRRSAAIWLLLASLGLWLVGVAIPIPAIAAAAAPSATPHPLAVYGSLPEFEMAALSPSGDRIAVIGSSAGKRRLVVIDKNDKPLMASTLGDEKIRRITWAGENLVLMEISKTVELGWDFTADKAELSSMVVIPVDTMKMWSVFGKKQSVTGGIRGFYGLVERDGRWFGYFGGITLEDNGRGDTYLNTTNPNLYEVDLQNGKATIIAKRIDEAERGYRDWVIGPDGKVVATLDFLSRQGNWKIVNADGKTIASGRSPTGGVSLISMGRSPGTILYDVTDDTNGGDQWFELPLAGGTPTEILQDEEVGGSYIDARSRLLIGYIREGDFPEAHFYDPKQNKAIAAMRVAFSGRTVRLIDWSDDFHRVIVRTDGVGDPQTWWKIDLSTGSAKALGASYPLAAADVGPVRLVHYKAQDGLDIPGILTLPPGRPATNLPVVVLPHGGPAARDYPAFDWWAQAFAAQGYAVFQPNFRGSTGYGAAFQRAGDGEWGRKMQTDISDGLQELAHQGIVDPKRACIMGASYGGYAALAGVTLQHGLYRCAVAVAGVSDVQQMVQTDVTTSGTDKTLIRALKAEVGSGRALKDISPIRFADKADAPVLLIHGKDDTVVMYDQSTSMSRALRQAGKPAEFVTLPGEDHWLSKSTTRLAMLQAALDFVERNNPPDPAR